MEKSTRTIKNNINSNVFKQLRSTNKFSTSEILNMGALRNIIPHIRGYVDVIEYARNPIMNEKLQKEIINKGTLFTVNKLLKQQYYDYNDFKITFDIEKNIILNQYCRESRKISYDYCINQKIHFPRPHDAFNCRFCNYEAYLLLKHKYVCEACEFMFNYYTFNDILNFINILSNCCDGNNCKCKNVKHILESDISYLKTHHNYYFM